MFLCFMAAQTAPSIGRSRPTKRASNFAGLLLSRTLRHNIRPMSRVLKTLDMLPWPVGTSSPKRFLMSTRGRLLLFLFDPNSFFSLARTPTGLVLLSSFPSLVCPRGAGPRLNVLMFAEIDDPGHFCAQIFAGHDTIDKPMLQQKLARLKALRQLQADRVPDRSLSGEADQSARLRQRDVALQGKAGGHSPHGGIRQNRDIEAARFVVPAQGGGHLGHLHERQDAFLHAGAASRTAYDN